MIFSLLKKCFFLTALCNLMLLPGAESGQKETVPEIFKADAQLAARYGLSCEHVQIEIPSLKRPYTFIWISDLHVIADDLSEVAEKSRPAMLHRRDKRFNNPRSGKNPAALWQVLPRLVNNSPADALLLGGDICDTGSVANLQLLKQGLKELKKPFIFLREDHDFTPWHLASKDMAAQKKISKEIDGHPELPFIEYEDLIVVGLDFSGRRIKPALLKQFKKLYSKKKPMIVLQHVPILPPGKTESSWMNTKSHVWGGRLVPQKVMGEFISLLALPNGQVKGVFSGHTHRMWDGFLAPGVRHHVFSPAFEGVTGVITLVPPKNK